MTSPSTPLIERFWAKTYRPHPEDCWLWIAGRSSGYGVMSVGRANGRSVEEFAHRFSYRTFVGDIPEGYEVDHTCMRRGCVNPSHLEAVTGAENKRRQGRRQTHCLRGHEYTAGNTYRDSRGCRRCRQCRHERKRVAA